jgi:hypothetical protein
MTNAPEETTATDRAKDIEGYAFTFCKAAFLALIFSKYTLLATSVAAVVLYIIAARLGVREWRCFVKPPWVVVVFAIIAAAQAYYLFFSHTELIL